MNIEQIAKTCHEVNRAYCKLIGDNSQKAWEDTPQEIQNSAINGVEYHASNPDSTPKDSHNNWWNQKIKDGWKYGEKKDMEKKTHPCMVEYEKLSKEQQAKDALFIAVVRSFTTSE